MNEREGDLIREELKTTNDTLKGMQSAITELVIQTTKWQEIQLKMSDDHDRMQRQINKVTEEARTATEDLICVKKDLNYVMDYTSTQKSRLGSIFDRLLTTAMVGGLMAYILFVDNNPQL